MCYACNERNEDQNRLRDDKESQVCKTMFIQNF